MTGDHRAIGLAAQPLSEAYRARVAAAVGCPLDVLLLSELRRHSLSAMWGVLRSIRVSYGLVVVEEPSGTPLLPVLQALICLTRCRHLATVGSDASLQALSRLSGVAAALSIVRATVAGLWATALCAIELVWAGPRRPRSLRGPVTRVAYLKTNLWFGLKAGGSVGHVAGVVNALARRGIEVVVCAVDRPPLLDRGVILRELPGPRHYGYPYELNYYAYHRRFVRQAAGQLEPARPDMVYHRLSVANYAGLRVAAGVGVPLVLEYNGSEVWVARHWGRALTFERLAARAEHVALTGADLVIVVSEPLREELLARGIAHQRILVQPNAVDTSMFDPDRFPSPARSALRARYAIDPTAVVCTFVGTFGRWHGVTALADTIAQLQASSPEWVRESRVHFLLVGDGHYMADVRERLREALALGVVTLSGLVPQADAPSYLAASDILLSPHVPNPDGSRFFGSPTKLFEYMAMGKGIVASDLEQIGEVLQPAIRLGDLEASRGPIADDALALLVTPGDIDELASAIRVLVDRPSLASALGRNARRRALERHTWARNVDQMLARLDSLGRDDP